MTDHTVDERGPTEDASSASTQPRPDDLEELLADCIEALERDGPAAVQDILRLHPDQAAGVARLLGSLGGMGLVDPDALDDTEPFVERVGEFRLLRRLGEGGMGIVFLARQESVDRLVAVKIVRPEHAGSTVRAERFRREAQAIAKLHHPNIVAIHAAGEDQGHLYIAMELVAGQPLDERLREVPDGGRLPIRDVLTWARDIATALDCAHRAGIVHRDVKPSNILIADDGRAVLLDFGLARESSAESLTLTGSFQGSPHFASPEQVAGRSERIGPETDIFSLGATVYCCLSGLLPFDGETTEQIFHQILTSNPPPLSRINARVTRELEAVILKAVEKEPAHRYATAQAFADDIDAVLEERPTAARPPGPLLRTWKWSRRHRAASFAILSLAALLLTLAIALPFSLHLLSTRQRALTDLQKQQTAKELGMAVLTLRDLPRAVDSLWPAVPRRISGPGSLTAWLDKAAELRANLSAYQRELAKLEQLEIPPSGPTTEARRFVAAELEKLPKWRAIAERKAAPEHRERLEDYLLSREQNLQSKLDWLYPPAFDSSENRSRYLAFRELVHGIPKLAPLVQQVEARRQFALDVKRLSIDEARQVWTEVIEAVRGDPKYGGLELAPQLGLVPLGRDPASGLFEFAHLQTGRVPVRSEDGALEIGDDTGLVFVLIPGGSFRMGAERPGPGMPLGSPNVDPFCHAKWESPVHEVTLAPFLLSKYEMTQGQWMRVTGENPSGHFAGIRSGQHEVTLSHPVEQVSWIEANKWMGRLDLLLPQETQWEYAARGGTTSVWPTGDRKESLDGAANIADRTAEQSKSTTWTCETWLDDGYSSHAPVGTYRPNEFGLYDVAGNLWEWCDDWFNDYTEDVVGDRGWRRGFRVAYRVARSGPYSSTVVNQRSAARARFLPDFTYPALGLRPARALQPSP